MTPPTPAPPVPRRARIGIKPRPSARPTSEVREAVLRALPGADVDSATPLGEGWACIVYRVSDGRGDPWAIRVPKPASSWATEDLEREAPVLPALQARGVPVPRSARLLRANEGAVLASIQRVVEGAPVKRAPRSRAEWSTLADDLGSALARLHAFPTDDARALGVSDRPMWEGHYAPMIERCLGLLPPASARWLDARARTFLDEGGTATAARVLIHADLSGEHIYASEDGHLEGIIDWADATLGDPALDFAGLLNDYPWRFLEAVLASYQAHGGAVDPDALRRARFYIDVAPIFGVLWATESGFPEVERKDRRRLAARAAIATRQTGLPTANRGPI